MSKVRCNGLPKCGDKKCAHAKLHEPQGLVVDPILCTAWVDCSTLDRMVGQRVYTRKVRCVKVKP